MSEHSIQMKFVIRLTGALRDLDISAFDLAVDIVCERTAPPEEPWNAPGLTMRERVTSYLDAHPGVAVDAPLLIGAGMEPSGHVRKLLSKLAKEKKLKKVGRGRYVANE